MNTSPLLSATLLALGFIAPLTAPLATGSARAATANAVAEKPALPADTFKTFVSQPVQSLDPLYVQSKAEKAVSRLVHRGLVSYSPQILPPRNGAYHQVIPAVASFTTTPSHRP